MAECGARSRILPRQLVAEGCDYEWVVPKGRPCRWGRRTLRSGADGGLGLPGSGEETWDLKPEHGHSSLPLCSRQRLAILARRE